MLIEITEDVANAIKANSAVAEVLRDLAYAGKKGVHYIVATKKVYEIIKGSALDDNTKRIYKSLSDTNIKGTEIEPKISFRVVLSLTENTHKSAGKIVMNISDCLNFNFCDETRLLCENLSDCKFFAHVLDFYKVNNKLGKRMVNEYEPMLGGGATLANVFEMIAKRQKQFCLTIADSDKYCPSQANNGKTAKDVEDKYLELGKPFNVYLYVLQKVCEIENLIPYSIVSLCDKTQRDFCLYYFDMKKGLSCCTIKNYPEASNYWDGLLKGNRDYKSKMKKAKNCRKSCKNKGTNRCHFVIVKGCGSDILDRALTAKVDWAAHKPTGDQYDEWMAIGKLICEWTCACKKIRC